MLKTELYFIIHQKSTFNFIHKLHKFALGSIWYGRLFRLVRKRFSNHPEQIQEMSCPILLTGQVEGIGGREREPKTAGQLQSSYTKRKFIFGQMIEFHSGNSQRGFAIQSHLDRCNHKFHGKCRPLEFRLLMIEIPVITPTPPLQAMEKAF